MKVFIVFNYFKKKLIHIYSSVLVAQRTNIQTTTMSALSTATTVPKKKVLKIVKIISSEFQTKEWRQENISDSAGQKDSRCEVYQRTQVKHITQYECPKSNGERINLESFDIVRRPNPMTYKGEALPDGFEWTEDFDGKQEIGDSILYYNLKFVCAAGGAQTRSLREVYHFVHSQIKHLVQYEQTKPTYFINILDGSQSFMRKPHFTYMMDKFENPELYEYTQQQADKVKKFIFVGDMKEFQDWWLENKANIQLQDSTSE